MKEQRLRANRKAPCEKKNAAHWRRFSKTSWRKLAHTVLSFRHVPLEILNHLRAKLLRDLLSRDGPRPLRTDLGAHSHVHTTQRICRAEARREAFSSVPCPCASMIQSRSSTPAGTRGPNCGTSRSKYVRIKSSRQRRLTVSFGARYPPPQTSRYRTKELTKF